MVLASVPTDDAEATLDALRQRLHAATRGRFDLGDRIAIDCDGPSIGAILARPARRRRRAGARGCGMYAMNRLRKAEALR